MKTPSRWARHIYHTGEVLAYVMAAAGVLGALSLAGYGAYLAIGWTL